MPSMKPVSAATMHAQAEGVPFILEELVRSYRDAAMIQEVDGVWTLAKGADKLLPSAVQTLIQRRSGRLPGRHAIGMCSSQICGRGWAGRASETSPDYRF